MGRYLCMYMGSCAEIKRWQVSLSNLSQWKAKGKWKKGFLQWQTTGVLFKGENGVLMW